MGQRFEGMILHTIISQIVKGSMQNKFSVKVGILAQPALPPPPLPERWDSQKGKKNYVSNHQKSPIAKKMGLFHEKIICLE